MLIVGGELYCEIFSQIFFIFFPNNYFKFIFCQLFFGLCFKYFLKYSKLLFPNTYSKKIDALLNPY